MKNFTTLFLMIAIPVFLFGQAADLFFSEYMEGSSNNKYLEIYNGTGADIDLSMYEIWRANNGETWDDANKFTLEGTITNEDVWIVCNSGAIDLIKNESDLVGTSITFYNGNDVIALLKSGEFLDIIGVEGEDPGNGNGWEVAGVSDGAKEHTLVRKSSVNTGNLDWVSSAGTNADDSEWIVLDQDDISNIGFHVFDGGSADFPPTISNLGISVQVPAVGEQIDVSATVTDDSNLVKVELRYAINEGGETVLLMASSGDDTYTGTVPSSAYVNGDRLVYYILAEDNKGQQRLSAETRLYVGEPTIADVKQLDAAGAILFDGYYARLSGVLTVASGVFSTTNLQVYLQDGSAAINLFLAGSADVMTRGNSYTVVGRITQFNGLIEIEPDDFVTGITDNGAGVLPAPIDITIAQLLSNPEAFESFLIKITGVDSLAGGDAWPATDMNSNINITDDAGISQIVMRIDRDTDIDGTVVPTFPINVTGIFNQFDNSLPFDDDYQILPRSLEDIDGVTAIEVNKPGLIPVAFKLYNAFPNPFNPETTLKFDLPLNKSKNNIELNIFNILGQKVAVLAKGKFNPGQHTFKWDAGNMPSGIYFAVLSAGNSQQISRLLLIK